MHSELIQALIHSQSDLCNLQLQTCSAGLDHTQRRVLCNRPARICMSSDENARPSQSKLKLPAPQRARASFSISLGSESWKTSITPPLKIAMDEPPAFSGPARHQSHSLKVQKDLFKSSELCCSTRCYLLLSALSQWIGLRFGKHISCSYFEHQVSSSCVVFF